ncbi:MAG: PAS domain S-box protein [bacterium]
MAHKLCIVVCENLKREVETIVESEELDDVTIVAFPADCGHSYLEWNTLKGYIHGCEDTYLLGGCCLKKDSPGEGETCHLLNKMDTCFSVFTNKNIIDHYIREGAFLLTPSWLENWRHAVIDTWGFDQRAAREFFKETSRMLVLLDTGVCEGISGHLKEFAGFVGLPFEIVPVGLDFFRMFLTKIVLEWRLKNERKESIADLAKGNRWFADYAMMFDLIGQLARISTEEKVIDNLFELITALFTPDSISYIPLVDGQQGDIRSHPASFAGREAVKNYLASFQGDYAWAESGEGFILRISHRQKTLGFLKIDGFARPEYKEHYLNLGLTITKILALAISNARAYLNLAKANEQLQQKINERIQAEEAVKLAYIELNQVFDTAADGMCVIGKDSRVLRVNDTLCTLFGLRKEDALGKKCHEVFHHSLCNTLCCPLEKVLGDHVKRLEFDIDLERKDGFKAACIVTTTPFRNPAGELIGIVENFKDITDRKRAEMLLQESEEKYSMLVEQARDGVAVVQDGVYRFVNKAMSGITGYAVEELTGKPLLDVVTPEYREVVEQRNQLTMSGQSAPSFAEVKIQCKDGTMKDVEVSGTIIKFNGKYARLGIIHDVTEHKRVENALKASEEQYRTFLKYFPGIAFMGELDFRPIFMHGASEEIIGYTEDEFVRGGLRWDQIIHPEDLPSIYKEAENFRLFPGYLRSLEFRIIRRDGQIRWVQEIIQNICDSSGKPIAVQGAIYDITDRKRAEEEKENAQTQFLQSQKMEAIGILAGGVAHDFNNLLTVIQGHTTLAEMRIDDSDPLSRDIKQIAQAAGKAANLTRQLLLFSRKQPMKPAVIDLNETVDNLLKMLHRLIGEDIAISVKLEPHLWRIRADEGTIEQMIMNLAVNARDAMPAGGKLIIRTEKVPLDEDRAREIPEARPGQFVCLLIGDTGTGIEKKNMDRIFEPFFTTKEVGKGTGLGLSVAYGIVKQHGGWITVDSEPGQGSIFRIYLPALSGEQNRSVKEKPSLQGLQGKNERILVVEDETAVRELFTKMLRENGYTVIGAENTQEALAAFEKEKGQFNLVLSDVVLPDQSGLELIEQLLERQPSLRVLLVSGYPDQKSQWSIIQEQGFRFLEKPFTLPDLLRAVKDAVTSGPRGK